VPRVLVWDGEGAVGRWRGKRMELTQACQEFRGTLAAKVQICKPADPEAKGLVERLHDYLERSFLPGRTFASPADFNNQLCGFVARANQRRHRVLGCRPVDRLDGDRQAMLSLPAVPPVTGWRSSTRLPRDHYLRLDGNDYSVHPAAIGRRVELHADLDRVRVWCEGRLVTDHPRIWAKHQSLTDPAHREAADQLRRNRLTVVLLPGELEVEQRRLSDYDLALGLGEAEVVAG
jgi:transposase